jgi:DNA-binding beta-propeller fold protein YncE
MIRLAHFLVAALVLTDLAAETSQTSGPDFTPEVATLEVGAVGGFAGDVRLALIPAVPGRIALTTVLSSARWLRPHQSENGINEVRLSFEPAGLAAGTHSATLTISSAVTVQSVSVRLTVEPLRLVMMSADPRRNRIHALHQPLSGAGRLLALDGTTRAITHSLPLGSKPTDLDLTPDGSRLYIAHANGDFRVFNPDTMRETNRHDLSAISVWNPAHDSNVSAGPGNTAFVTDGSWPPFIHVLDTSSGTVLQSVRTGPANRPNDTGCGDLVYHPERRELFTWNQDGWNTGSYATSISRFAVAGDGRLTLNGRATPPVSPPNFRQDRFDAPILLSADGQILVVKDRRIDMDDLSIQPVIHPQVIYSMSRTGGAVFGETSAYRGGGGGQVMPMPVATRVHTVAPDGKRLLYFHPGTGSVQSINIEATFNTQNLGISRLPEADTVAQRQGQIIRWEPVPGAREYRVYLADNAAALSAAMPDASLLAGKSREHWFVPDGVLPTEKSTFWRVDAWTNRGVLQGQVRSMFVGQLSLDRSLLAFKTVAGTDGRSESISITSPDPVGWTAVANATWLKFSTTSSTTPSTLEIIADATNLGEGWYTATVTVRHGSRDLRLPVELTVRPRNFTRVVADPDRPHLHLLNSSPGDHALGAFLMRFNTTTERIDRVVEVPYDVRAMAFHQGDQKIHLGYGAPSASSSIASVAVPEMATVAGPTHVPALDEVGAFHSHWTAIIPGPAGLLVADKNPEFLLDTKDFSLVTQFPFSSYASAFHPSGPDYYAGINGNRGPIRKYRLENNRFVETASRQLSLHPVSLLDSSLLVSTDGSRVSWARTILDQHLNELFVIPSTIFTLSHGGELAATSSRLYNARTGMEIGPLPVDAPLQGMSSDRMRLFQFQAASWQRANLFEMTALPPDGAITTQPADGAVVVGPSHTLSWTGVPTALEYRVFFGTDAAAVAAAGMDDPEHLGLTNAASIQIPGSLAPGSEYFWRVEMTGYRSAVSSPVKSFRVAPITATPNAMALTGPVGVPMPDERVVPLTSPVPLPWAATTTTPWLRVVTTSGTSPADLRFEVLTAGLTAGNHEGDITLSTPGIPAWRIPVSLRLDPANITESLLDPVSGRIYGISQNARAVIGNNNELHPAHLVVYDRATGLPRRSVPVGTSVSQFIIHEAENRIYIANWKSGHLRALDLDSLEEVALFPFTPYNTIHLAVGDVYALAAGPAGRVVMGKGPSGSSGGIGQTLLLVNTATGAIIAESMTGFHRSRIISEPSGTVIQQPVSGRRVEISGDTFTLLKQTSLPLGGTNPVFRNVGGTRYFSSNIVLDSEMNVLRSFAQGQNASAVTPTGEIMLTSNRVQNVVTGMEMATLPITTSVMALDDENHRLHLFPGNQIQPTSVDFAALADLPPGDLVPGIANGTTVIGTTWQLGWEAERRAFSYQVYFGTDAAAVAAAGPDDPEFLGETTESSLPAPAPLGYDVEYFWRVDVTARNGTRTGSVWSFRVAPINVEPRAVAIDHPRGVPVTTRAVAILTGSPAGEGAESPEWTATTSTPWISLVTGSGVAPGTLQFDVNPAGLSLATHHGTIRIASGGREFDLPVSLTLHALNYMMLTSDPDQPLLYAISRPSNQQAPSFLVVIDAHREVPILAFPVGWGATDVTVHPEESRIYISNWAAGELRALDRDSFEQVFFRQYPSPVVGGSDVVHAVAAGRAGRIAITEGDQSGQVRLADSATGDILASRSVGAGYGVFDPTKRFLYYGVNSSSQSALQKYDTQGDQLQEIASVGLPNYLPRQVHMNAAGDRLFWGYHMVDADLNSLWTFRGPTLGLGTQRVAAIDPAGEWLLTMPQSGTGMIWNTLERRSLFNLTNFSWGEGTTPYRPFAFNKSSGKFHHAASNLLHSFEFGPFLPPEDHPDDVRWLTFGQSRWRAAPGEGEGVLATTVSISNERSMLSLFVPEAATVEFEWMLKSDSSFNSLTAISSSGGSTLSVMNQWLARTVSIPAGGGTVTWSAHRSSLIASPATGYVRNIVITPLVPPLAAMAAAGVGADLDDPANLIAWATGSDPGSGPHLSLLRETDGIRVEFDRRQAAADAPRVTLESSTDLVKWEPVDEAGFHTQEVREGIERVRLSLPLESTRRFLRLRVEAPRQP